jgi:peptidoglycan/LPS O-acetylase OafA/YrhL
MVFQRTDGLLSAESSASARLMLIVISVGIAYLSWKLIETPFRAMARERSKVAVFATTSGAQWLPRLHFAGWC